MPTGHDYANHRRDSSVVNLPQSDVDSTELPISVTKSHPDADGSRQKDLSEFSGNIPDEHFGSVQLTPSIREILRSFHSLRMTWHSAGAPNP